MLETAILRDSPNALASEIHAHAIYDPPTEEWYSRADLAPVTEALQTRVCATGQPSLMLGGWDVEDPAITPPADVRSRLRQIAPQPTSYAYSKDFHQARALAAEVYGAAEGGLRLGETAPTAKQVAVTPNSSQGLLLALSALREEGVCQAIIVSPCYFSLAQVCRHLGLDVVFIPTRDFLTGALDISRIRQAIVSGSMSARRSVVILTNPAYSVGVEYSASQLQMLFAALPSETHYLFDEARIGLNWTTDQPWPPMEYPSQSLVLRSPSKLFFLNGAKTSFLFGPAPTIRTIDRLSEILIGSASGEAEAMALAYLEALRAWQDELRSGRVGPLRAWKQSVVAALKHNLSDAQEALTSLGFHFSPVDSGPYALAAIPRETHGIAAQVNSLRAARRHGVLLLTSEHFYHWSAHWVGFRINLSGEADHMRAAVARVFGEVAGVGESLLQDNAISS